jgi:tetratricopeptide (TPR) repeat protein
LNPYNLEGQDQYSTVLWHLNNKEELFALYLKFKKQFLYSSQYYIIRGNYYSFTGANEKAIQSFRQALETDKAASYALFLEGHDWLSLNNIEEAEKAFESLSRFNPDSYMS